MKKQFAQIRGDEILHLSYNQRAEEIERLNKHVDAQAATIAQLREALEPFAHPDLCKRLPNNGSDDNAVIFVRNQAVITLADCNRAARALKGGE